MAFTEMTAHREALKAELAKIHLKDVTVIDWGAGSKPASRYIMHENCTFFTVDKNNSTNPDKLWDITDAVYIDEFDVAFCLEVIEHVTDVQNLIDNIRRNLKPVGVVYMSVPFQFEVHSDDDYWRFTENGIRLLLKGLFPRVEITPIDNNSGYFVRATK